eukprot:1505173-Prymnesium_polylepis.1
MSSPVDRTGALPVNVPVNEVESNTLRSVAQCESGMLVRGWCEYVRYIVQVNSVNRVVVFVRLVRASCLFVLAQTGNADTRHTTAQGHMRSRNWGPATLHDRKRTRHRQGPIPKSTAETAKGKN